MTPRFESFRLPEVIGRFDDLIAGVDFDEVSGGRRGAVLVLPHPTRGTPIVRTTTRYGAPAQSFGDGHRRLAAEIQSLCSLSHAVNNALIEVYDNRYAKMKAHSDQALDLVEGSTIALFTAYRYPERATPPRKLVVHSKQEGGERFEVPLLNESVVVFSLEANRRHRHKIVLDRSSLPPENEWLGITFRSSKTYVQVSDDGAHFENGAPLRLATEEQAVEFLKLRGRENREQDFEYSALGYTLSPSDLLKPTVPHADS